MAQGQQRTSASQQQQPTPGKESARMEAQRPTTPTNGRSAINLSAIAMRGFGQLYDMQAAAARMMMQTQARAACAFGLPDYSDLFRFADDRAKHVFSASTEHLIHTAEQATETISEVQRQVGRLVEYQTVTAAENWQHGLQELEAQAEENLSQLKELARQQADQALLAVETLGEAARESLREGREQIGYGIAQSEAAQLAAGQAREETWPGTGETREAAGAEGGESALPAEEEGTPEGGERSRRKGR